MRVSVSRYKADENAPSLIGKERCISQFTTVSKCCTEGDYILFLSFESVDICACKSLMNKLNIS